MFCTVLHCCNSNQKLVTLKKKCWLSFSTFSLAFGPGTLSLSVDSLQLCPCSSKWGEQLWGERCVLCKWLTDSSSCLSRPRLYLHTPLSCSARCHSSMHFSLLLLRWWTQHIGVDSGYEWRQLLLPRSIFYDMSTDTWVGYSWQCFTVTLLSNYINVLQ